MVLLKKVVADGRLEDQKKVVEEIWMPIKKRLKESVIMVIIYDEKENTTTFQFTPNALIYNDYFVASVGKQLQKAVHKGREITADNTLRSMVGKVADYMTISVSDEGEEVTVAMDRERLDAYLLAEATMRFVDKLHEILIE